VEPSVHSPQETNDHMTGTVLLTGATGFIGHQILDALGKLDVPVRVVVRPQLVEWFAPPTVERVIVCDDIFIKDRQWWADTCVNVDTVIHAAWYAEPGQYLNSRENVGCLIGTLEMARGAVDAGIRRFVGLGTCYEYDLTPGVLPVSTPLKPLTPYAAAKVSTYIMLSQWLPTEDVEFLWCRLFNLFGAREDARRLVPYLRDRLAKGEPAELTSGAQIRDFLDVTEAGRIIAEEAVGTRVDAVNVCSGSGVTVRAFAESIADEYGRRDLLRFGARPDAAFDPPCVVGAK
jgi:nucleoside-diphosphate-sugar epimerase